MKLPIEILKALNVADIQINTSYQFQFVEIKNHLRIPKLFNSYEIGVYKSSIFRYTITIPNIEGEIILEKTENSIRIIKNTLTLDKD